MNLLYRRHLHPGLAALYLGILSCLLSSAATPSQTAGGVAPVFDSSTSPLRSRIQIYDADRRALERVHPFEVSPVRRERFRRFFQEHVTALEAVDFEALALDSRIDYLLLRSRLRFELSELERESAQVREMAPWIPFASNALEVIQAPRGVGTPDMPAFSKAVTALAASVESTRQRLDQALKARSGNLPAVGIPSKVVANRVMQTLDSLRTGLTEWNRFYAGYHPEFTWWMRQPFEHADKQLVDYTSLLRKEVLGVKAGDDAPLIGDPIGRKALEDALTDEMIPYSPEELLAIAEQEMRWCEKEWARAANDLGLKGDWRQALDRVSNLHVKPGDQPTLIRQLAEEAIAFLEARDLVTIPSLCKEVWRMEMMTPERQKVNPYFTGGEVISISFPTDTMAHDDKEMSLRGNNIHFCRATVQHELIPGHHLQGFMAARYRTHRSLFETPFLVEGWALYWEMLLWDLGFPTTAEDRVGMLFWRTHRCARILFSLKFHMGQMTAEEAVDFLVDKVGHERRNATAEVRRSILGAYGPLYQAAYMLGGLQFRALREELVVGGKMTHRQFHDAVLRENSIPIEMIRASLSGQTLTRDYTPRWKFYRLKP